MLRNQGHNRLHPRADSDDDDDVCDDEWYDTDWGTKFCMIVARPDSTEFASTASVPKLLRFTPALQQRPGKAPRPGQHHNFRQRRRRRRRRRPEQAPHVQPQRAALGWRMGPAAWCPHTKSRLRTWLNHLHLPEVDVDKAGVRRVLLFGASTAAAHVEVAPATRRSSVP